MRRSGRTQPSQAKKLIKPAIDPAAAKRLKGDDGDQSEDQQSEPADDWTPPTAKEWVHLKAYRSYERSGNRYSVGHFIYLSPTGPRSSDKNHGGVKEDTWIAQIVDVRAVDSHNVFIKVRWAFTSLGQLMEINAQNTPKELDSHEIVLADDSYPTDFQHVSCVDDLADVKLFDESNPAHEAISTDKIFYRSELRAMKPKKKSTLGKRKARAVEYEVVPINPPSCTCGLPYDPLPLDQSPMVYCPRDSCCRWYHSRCLDSRVATAEDLIDIQSSGVGMTDVDIFNQSPSQPPAYEEVAPSSSSPRPGRKSKIDLPDELVSASKLSISRGSQSDGIVGNGLKVLTAREIIASKTSPAHPSLWEVIQTWTTEYGSGDVVKVTEGDASKKTADEEGEDVPIAVRPGKKKGRRSELKIEAHPAHGGTGQRRVWECPSCRGPI